MRPHPPATWPAWTPGKQRRSSSKPRGRRGVSSTHSRCWPVVGAGVFLFGYGAVWWSMHDQHVYSGPAGWSLALLYGLIAVSAIVGGVALSRANAGVSGRARRQRQAQAAAVAAAGSAPG